jgi:hypothetical protein
MSSSVYELIGRIIVRLAWARYGRQIQITGAVLGVLLAGGVFLAAKRQPPEG